MKLINTILLSLCLLTPVTIVQTGCTTSAQRVTYNTLYSVSTGVNSAYAAYNDRVVAGTSSFSPNVARAYNDFQSAMLVATQAAQFNINAAAPQNIVDLANAVYAAIKQFTK